MSKNEKNIAPFLTLTLLSVLLVLLPIWLFKPEPSSQLDFQELQNAQGAKLDFSIVHTLPQSLWGMAHTEKTSLTPPTNLYRWHRLVLPGMQDPNAGWVLEIKFPFFVEVALAVYENDQLIEQKVLQRSQSQAPRDSPFFQFYLPRGQKDRVLYVRTFALAGKLPRLIVRKDAQLRDLASVRFALMGIMGGISLFLLCLKLALLLAQRTRAALFQTLIVTFFTCDFYLLLGYDRWFEEFNRLESTDWIRLLLVLCVLGFGCLTQYLWDETKLNRTSKILGVVYRTLAAAHGLLAVVIFALPLDWALAMVGSLEAATILWLYFSQIRFGRVVSTTWVFASHWIPTLLVGISAAEYYHQIPDTLYARFAGFFGIAWLGYSYAITNAYKLRYMTKRQLQINDALAVDHDKTKLNSLLTSAYDEGEITVEADVTIMFVDIVQFSQISARYTASAIYRGLAQRMRELVTIVERHGGVVDRSIGDGVLCFFGYAEGLPRARHASAALRAADEIQQLSAHLAVTGSEDDMPIMPMRIGIHSARVVIGNLGDASHMDFTMIGSGVNFASRLETACTPFKVMLSQASKDLLLVEGADPARFDPIAVAIKHHQQLIAAFEYDPFYLQPQQVKRAHFEFFKQNGISRREERITIAEDRVLYLESELGRFTVRDLSVHGLNASALFQVGRRARLLVRLVSSNETLNRKLRASLLDAMVVEVRWSQRADQHFAHGLKIFGNSQPRREFLFGLLSEHLGTTIASAQMDEIMKMRA